MSAEKYEEFQGIEWEWQSMDGGIVQAPTDRLEVHLQRKKVWEKILLIEAVKEVNFISW
jgi:hypothetical protein